MTTRDSCADSQAHQKGSIHAVTLLHERHEPSASITISLPCQVADCDRVHKICWRQALRWSRPRCSKCVIASIKTYGQRATRPPAGSWQGKRLFINDYHRNIVQHPIMQVVHRSSESGSSTWSYGQGNAEICEGSPYPGHQKSCQSPCGWQGPSATCRVPCAAAHRRAACRTPGWAPALSLPRQSIPAPAQNGFQHTDP